MRNKLRLARRAGRADRGNSVTSILELELAELTSNVDFLHEFICTRNFVVVTLVEFGIYEPTKLRLIF